MPRQNYIISPDEAGVHKTMSGPGIDKSGKFGEGVRDERRGEKDMEGVGIGKSRRVEADCLHRCTGRVNAVLSLCGGLRAA